MTEFHGCARILPKYENGGDESSSRGTGKFVAVLRSRMRVKRSALQDVRPAVRLKAAASSLAPRALARGRRLVHWMATRGFDPVSDGWNGSGSGVYSMTKRVLVVDDSAFSRKMTIRSLPEEYKKDLRQAANGEEAIQTYEEWRPNLVLMDLTMPKVDGFEALGRIKAIDPSACVVIVTADIQAGAQQKCQELGAAAILAKPLDPKALLEVLDGLG